ncbi:NADP-dependent phosphogluconate dehydrogenase [Lysobacter sp. Root494]|uniref:NADP-dependent phosphogluconate dehydrogenase n=1 Tax=Lysobacter sp. Root494 TaxID=1736549 RepID=UPI0009EA2BC1|nr:NADP-dependent phosphogluconate dehydrogenase [Lysobacter sp. Root494]
MANPERAFAIVGLGRMGGNLARQALGKGMRVVGHARRGPPAGLLDDGLEFIERIEDVAHALAQPRRVLLYVPAGRAIDDLLHRLRRVLDPGDVVVDGGNSYWGDSIRRHRRLRRSGIAFVDAGTSGGLQGARDGACFMVGGEEPAVACVAPILKELACDGGFVHAGPPGSGHFVKLVHNGIEFGMLQAIGEGVDLLEHCPAPLPIADILRTWRHGSVIRSWLIELMEQAYRNQHGLTSVPSHVEDTGEVNWLVDDALHMEVAIPVIAQSVLQLLASRDRERYPARVVGMLRHGFGGHPYGRDERIARERACGRVGAYRPFGHAPRDHEPGCE